MSKLAWRARSALWMLRAAAIGVVGIGAVSRADTPSFDIHFLGLTDAQHTNSSGGQSSSITALYPNGMAIGSSNAYDGSTPIGGDGWIYSGGVVTQIGLTGGQYLASDGTRFNGPQAANASGQVIGLSTQFSGTNLIGTDAWLFSGGQTKLIGLTDAAHTDPNGSRNVQLQGITSGGKVIGLTYTSSKSDPWEYDNGSITILGLKDAAHTFAGAQSGITSFNDAGDVLGHSPRIINPEAAHYDDWLYKGGTTVMLGLSDAAHLDGNGYANNSALSLNAAGQVAGGSQQFNVGGRGFTSWIYSGGTYKTIGFFDAAHTASDGTQFSSINVFNDNGYVLGTATRYNGTDENGTDSWLYNGTTTVPVGLSGPQYTCANGSMNVFGNRMNAAGQVVGTSAIAGNNANLAAWIYSGGVNTRIGIVDAQHSSNLPAGLNAAGQVIGSAFRTNFGTSAGEDAWIYSGGSTSPIGLTDSQHTRSDGYRENGPMSLNDAGQVIGFSQRFNGMTQIGQSGWFYDANQHLTSPLVFSVATDGTANTNPQFLTATGSVLGTYTKYSGTTATGTALFYWKAGIGEFDLAQLALGGLSASGWSSLDSIQYVNASDQIGGLGTRTAGNTSAAFLLDPSIVLWQPGANLNAVWNASSSWSSGRVPSSVNNVVLNATSTPYTTSFSADAAANGLNVTAGDVSLNLSGHTLSLGGALHVGDSVTTPTTTLHVLGGTMSAPAGVSVFTNATLKGTGTIAGPLNVSGGTVAPGNSPGTLHTGSVAFSSNSALAIEIAGTGAGQADQLDVAGTVSLGGATLNLALLNGYLPGPNDSFRIINNDGTDPVTGRFGNLTPSGFGWDSFVVGNTQFRVDYNLGDGNDVMLSVVAAPEPHSLAVLAVLSGGMLTRRRRR